MSRFKNWSSASLSGAGKSRKKSRSTKPAGKTRQKPSGDYKLSDVSDFGLAVVFAQDTVTFTITGRFVSLNFIKYRHWKEIKSIENAVEERIYNCLMSELGSKTLPVRFDRFSVHIRYNSLMDPENTITIPKIFTDALVDQYEKDLEGNKVMVDGVPRISWKGLFFDDDKKFNAGITGIVPDMDLPHDTYILTYKREPALEKTMKKSTRDRMKKILDEYDGRKH